MSVTSRLDSEPQEDVRNSAVPRAPILERVRSELDAGRIPVEVFNSEEIHALEQERLFSRTWCFLAHESEIPEVGDYLQRSLGGNSVIVTRDASGGVHCLLNMCTHRGMQVCKADCGNTSRFRCSYHGWTFSNDGRLVVVPQARAGYGEALHKEEWGLAEYRTDSYAGLIFGCLDEDAEPLSEYLGDFRFYLDLFLRPGPGGTEVYAPPNKWVADMNWKFGAENFAGDGYHTPVTHQFGFELGYYPSTAKTHTEGIRVHIPDRGHAIGLGRTPGLEPFFGFPEEVAKGMRSILSEDQLSLFSEIRSAPATVFPNFSLLLQPLSVVPGEPGVWFCTIRLWHPLGPDRMQMLSWCLVPRDAPDNYKQAAYHAYILGFGQAGTFDQDDFDNWVSATRMVGSPACGELSFPYLMGLDSKPIEGFVGPGMAVQPYINDAGFRSMWRHWLELLERP
ncbi:MAG: aromatic ring-hydroxylating oxygenase subunit alpha [Acidimicrobiales bacterium]